MKNCPPVISTVIHHLKKITNKTNYEKKNPIYTRKKTIKCKKYEVMSQNKICFKGKREVDIIVSKGGNIVLSLKYELLLCVSLLKATNASLNIVCLTILLMFMQLM